MIPVHKLLLKFLKDRHVHKEEIEIAVQKHPQEPYEYYNFTDIIVDKDNPDTFTFIDEKDNFLKIPYENVRKVLRNEKPVWDKNIEM